MCYCGKPNINGQFGYSWDGKSFSTRPVNAPTLGPRDVMVFDEPGRCGGIDAHSHHFTLVKEHNAYILLVRHGGGDERIRLCSVTRFLADTLADLDSNARYWFLHLLYSTHEDARRSGIDSTNTVWRKAAAEKRIKTRSLPKRGIVKVWIVEPAPKYERDENVLASLYPNGYGKPLTC